MRKEGCKKDNNNVKKLFHRLVARGHKPTKLIELFTEAADNLSKPKQKKNIKENPQ